MVTDEGSSTKATTRWSPLLTFACIVGGILLVLLWLSSQERYVYVDTSGEFFAEGEGAIYEEAEAGMWVDFLQVTLQSNRRDGFEWELTDVTGQTRLELISKEYVPPMRWMVGADGTEVWTFAVEMMGGATISMEYGQPWEGGAKAARTFVLTLDH